jgi:hypothetical protein
VDRYWEEMAWTLRMEVLGLGEGGREGGREGGGKGWAEDRVVWTLEAEQGLMPTRRRVLLTPSMMHVSGGWEGGREKGRERGREGGREGGRESRETKRAHIPCRPLDSLSLSMSSTSSPACQRMLLSPRQLPPPRPTRATTSYPPVLSSLLPSLPRPMPPR